jgi:hypothetical protein
VDSADPATVGVPEQSSTLIAGARVHGTLLHERFGYGAGGNFATARSFAVRAGVPPQILDETIDAQTHLFAMAEYFCGVEVPLWVSLRVWSALPDGAHESPLTDAAHNNTTAVLGVAYREE